MTLVGTARTMPPDSFSLSLSKKYNFTTFLVQKMDRL